MKVLLQNTRTGYYFQSPYNWTSEVLDACDFGEIAAALTFAARNSIPHVQLRLKFEGENYKMANGETDEDEAGHSERRGASDAQAFAFGE